MTTFAVKFLGCKVSQADMIMAREALLAAGHTEVDEEHAELQLVNTCCITSEAQAKSRQSVRRSLKNTRQVYVTGCAANLDAGQFAAIDPRVHPLVGTADDVADTIAAVVRADLGACADLEHDVLARSLRGDSGQSPSASSRTRGFVKVQDGCDCHCAYCIIPTVRGAARSRPASAVLDEVRRRVAAGQPEMVMTGISVGDYRDPENGLELGELMLAVARIDGVARVRLSSVEVIHVRDSLIEALLREPKVCPHLHIPMQSGDDGVLAAMGRHYDAEQYLASVAALRAAVPRVNITTDVIVGFPTEDDAAFGRTLALIDAAADHARARVLILAKARDGRRRSRRSRPAGREEASLAAAQRPCRGSLPASPREQAWAKRARADRQARRHAMLGLHGRLHPRLPARRCRRARGADRRHLRRASRRWDPVRNSALTSATPRRRIL